MLVIMLFGHVREVSAASLGTVTVTVQVRPPKVSTMSDKPNSHIILQLSSGRFGVRPSHF